MGNWIQPDGGALSEIKNRAFLFALSVLIATGLGCAKNNYQPSELLSDEEYATGIVGGTPVSQTDPIAASTVAVLDAASGQAICTGTLIASNLVLTAAHCTDEGLTTLAVGFGLKLTGQGQQVVRRVVGGKVHPDWAKLTPDKEKNWGDLAVLKFSGAVPTGFRPANLVTSKAALVTGGQAILAGYGLIDMIHQVETDRLRKATVVISNAAFSDTEIEFKQYKGRGACHGDSGGPAFVKSGKAVLLAGVTSRSATERGGSTCLEGSIYTSIPGQLGFIQSTISLLGSK